MRIAVASCFKYRDAWPGFFGLLRKFWTDCPYPVDLITDGVTIDAYMGFDFFYTTGSWCQMVGSYAKSNSNEPILLMQDDFWLSAPVDQVRIEWVLGRLHATKAGMVRLYPCPGADEDYGDPYIGLIWPGAPYAISLQASIWDPKYLAQICEVGSSPSDFELKGTPLSVKLDRTLLSWKRGAEPWPIQYICSAISRGKWNPDAKKLCDQHGIAADWSMRPMDAR